jgi:hypothetical protein
MGLKIQWSVVEVAKHLGISVTEVRELIDAGFLHCDDVEELRFDAAAVKEWRRGLEDGGERGAAYVREVLAESATRASRERRAGEAEAPPR